MNQRAGASFEEADVVANYAFRPPYPDTMFQKLIEIAPAHESLLDIGCGPGKISRALVGHFDTVTAVDPSVNMIALGRSMPEGHAPNLEWVAGFAEEFPIEGRKFDLTVAAASIHWMDHARLFPHLARHGQPDHLVAVVSGDDAFEPPWQADWVAFLERWVPAITGEAFDPVAKAPYWDGYQRHLDVKGDELFMSAPFVQTASDFIRCQHSRDTFAPSKLGPRLADFDAELAEIIQSHTIEGRLTYRVQTRLVWGTIKSKWGTSPVAP